MVLESPYNSLAEVAASKYPMFPVRLLFAHEFASEAHIKKTDAEMLLIHGARDGVIPVRFGEKLRDAVGKPVGWKVIYNAGHNDLTAYGSIQMAAEFFSAE